MQKLSFACWRWYHCNVAVAPPAGPHLRGALPCRAPLQPWCQRCRGGGERTDRLRLQARLCRGSTTGRITSKHRHRVSVLCRQLNVCFLFFFSARAERAETDGPRQPGGPLTGWDRPCRATVWANHHSEEVPTHTQSQDWIHGGEAD